MSKKEQNNPSILLINRYFYPDVAAVAQLMGDLAEDFIKEGMDVGVIRGNTSYNEKENTKVENEELFERVDIHKVLSVDLDSRSSIIHLINFLSFHISALLRLLRLKPKDVVITFTSPPLISFEGYLSKLFKGSKFVHVVEDIYPEVAAEMGFINKGSGFTNFARSISGFILRRADKIVVLSDNMKEKILERNVDENKVKVIPNWNDGDKVYPVPDQDNWFTEDHDLRGKFIVEYSGHMGEGHDFDPMLECAESMQVYEDIVFLFIGDGPRKEEIQDYVKTKGLGNVKLLPYQERSDLRFSLSAADVSLVSLRSNLKGLIVPSKIYGILAAGSPVVYLGDEESEIARIVKEAECGEVVSSESTKGLEKAIRKIYSDEGIKKEYGRNARSYFMENFDRKIATEKYCKMIKETINENLS